MSGQNNITIDQSIGNYTFINLRDLKTLFTMKGPALSTFGATTAAGAHCVNQLAKWTLYDSNSNEPLKTSSQIIFNDQQDTIAVNTQTYNWTDQIELRNDKFYG